VDSWSSLAVYGCSLFHIAYQHNYYGDLHYAWYKASAGLEPGALCCLGWFHHGVRDPTAAERDERDRLRAAACVPVSPRAL
jgi:hypothetical protein